MEKNNSKIINEIKIQSVLDLVKETVINCYGVVAIAKKSEVIDKLKSQQAKGKNEEAIFVRIHSDKTISADIHLIFAKDIKITEALMECQKILKYKLNHTWPKCCRDINVFAEGLL